MAELPKHISYSAWQQYRHFCQWRWKLDNADGLKSKAFGIYLDFGTAVHGAIEKYKTRKNPVSMQDAQKLFEDSFRELHKENSEKYKEKEKAIKVDDFVAAGRKIIEEFDSCQELRDSEVLYNEHDLYIDIDREDPKMKFKGFIDMVVKTKDKRGNTILYVVDFKTCSWGWTQDKKRDRELQYQLFLYKHFLCKKFNLDPKNVRTAFVLLKRSPRKDDKAIEFFPVSAGPISVQRALDEINTDITDMGKKIVDDSFERNRKSCKNEWGDTCPYFGTDKCKEE